jgi:uncharacterized protein YcbK (DUF882 family)
MRPRRLARPLACALLLGSAAVPTATAVTLLATSALAQPPVHTRVAKHAPSSASASTSSSKAAPSLAPTTKPGSAAAAAYMSGKQALVGFHAASTKSVERDPTGRAMLTLSTINRGETLSIAVSGDDGGFDAADLDRVAHLLRAATGDEHPVDPRTLGLVYRIQTHFDVPEIRVISGYRVPKPGSHSNHGKGRAIDLAVPGVPDEDVARFVREQGFVGCGVYPSSQFVHVDVRPRSYFWVDYSGPHMKNRERGILGDLASKSDAAALARGQEAVEPFGVATDVDAAMRARGLAGANQQSDDEDEDD